MQLELAEGTILAAKECVREANELLATVSGQRDPLVLQISGLHLQIEGLANRLSKQRLPKGNDIFQLSRLNFAIQELMITHKSR